LLDIFTQYHLFLKQFILSSVRIYILSYLKNY